MGKILTRRSDYLWELPIGYVEGMRVPGKIFADPGMIATIEKDGSLNQVANAATLPGIVKASYAMPDIHFGYGFPIGGVLATRIDTGVVSPGGVGFDINCGVRLMTTPITRKGIQPHIRALISKLFQSVPSGVGSRGKIKLNSATVKKILLTGSKWAIDNGYGDPADLLHTEAEGCMGGALPDEISPHAIERGKDQVGTLGSGNHFIEVQYVDEIFDPEIASAFGLQLDQTTIMIHSGSRGLGHQVCTDFLKTMSEAVRKYKISIPDRQLACAPINSAEGRRYLGALSGAANFAWANRQCMTHWIREVMAEIFNLKMDSSDIKLVYDLAHNIVKIETHEVDGKRLKLAVHRKGATRAYGPFSPDLPGDYMQYGQPVIIPGDMGTASYVMAGTAKAMEEAFGSACHGAGRLLSRKAAKKAAAGRSIEGELGSAGILVKAAGRSTINEEMPDAYKNIHQVIEVIKNAGLAKIVARLKPLGVIKG